MLSGPPLKGSKGTVKGVGPFRSNLMKRPCRGGGGIRLLWLLIFCGIRGPGFLRLQVTRRKDMDLGLRASESLKP